MASRLHHVWRWGEPPPVIEAHSLVKHRLFASYIRDYIKATTKIYGMERLSLTIIDGFAGGNVYRHWKTGKEVEGSPSVILAAIAEAESERASGCSKDFFIDCHFVFIEKNPDAFHFLQETLATSEAYRRQQKRVTLLNGDFNSYCDLLISEILSRGKTGRSIFILDQCGFTGVTFDQVKNVLSCLNKSEVLMTFATDFLLNYLRKDEEKTHFIRKLGLHIPVDISEEPRSRAESRRALQYFLHKKVREYCTQGGETLLDQVHYTPFFVRSDESNRDFWIIHLSKNYKARDVMVQQHWNLSNSSAHYGTSGYKMLGYEPGNDSKLNRQLLLDGYMFDESARNSTVEALHDDLPTLLRKDFPGGTDLKSLYSAISNETPATVELVEKVLRSLLADRVIDVRDPSGRTKRIADVKLDDIIKADRQKKLFY
jgi:three-Cys-motif partner protein